MTQPEQAVLIWPVLALAAREQKILSYSDLAGFTGIAEYGLGEALGLIHAHCERKKWLLLNSIVVLRETGVPGGGFPAKNMTPMEVSVMQSRVFLFDWSGHDKPRVHDFSATA